MKHGKRGRPPKAYLLDPDRHVMSLAVLHQTLGCSRRGSIEVAVCSMEGIPTGPNPNHGWGHGLNLLDVTYELKHRPGAAATIAGRSRTIRQKLKRWVADDRQEATHWLTTMARAWAKALDLSMPGRPTDEGLKALATIAESVGEAEFCRNVLIPLAKRGSVKK